ncbi:MAG TPA: hypothetical protein VI894_03485 [Candidatus Nanoarchaeia archaeon]|nr:hypothetical protein [Candidatus Nanoarchaeia archaeon]
MTNLKKVKTPIAVLLILVISFFLIFFSLKTSADSAPDTPNLRITLVNQDSDPAEPGSSVDVRIKVENIGNKATDNVFLEIIPDYPLTVSELEKNKTTGSLGGFQTGADAVIKKFRLSVADDAREGTAQIRVKYKVAPNSAEITTSPFNISIKSADAIVALNSIKLEPEVVSPSQASSISLEIENIAKIPAKDVRVTLDLSSTSLPFAPIGSSNEQSTEILSSGEKQTLQFRIMAQPSANPDLYKLPIVIKYHDGSGKNYTRNYVAGILVNTNPGVALESKASNIYKAGDLGTVTLKIINTESTTIKFLTVSLAETSDYEVLSNNKVYVGKIDSDDYENVDYKIKLKRVSDSRIELPVAVDFQDSVNNKYVQKFSVPLKIVSKEKLGIKNGNNTAIKSIIAIIIVILVALIIYYRKIKRKK